MTKSMEGRAEPALLWVRSNALRLRLGLEIVVWRHGWIWPLALSSVVLALAFGLWSELDGRRSAAELQALADRVEQLAALKEAEARQAQSSGSVDEVQVSPMHSRRERLVRVLRQPNEVTTQLRQMYEYAESVQLVIQQADFQQGRGAGGIDRLQVNLPVKGSYVQLRAFVELLLRGLPNASVDKLVLKRNQVGQVQLEANLHLSLWLREHSPGSIEAGGLEAQR